MNLSIVIPIGKFSWFVEACLQNIIETCGFDSNELDIIYLLEKDPPSNILDALDKARRKYKFRTVITPFDDGFSHVFLLDWAFNNIELRPWIVIQHCDFFWRKQDWLHEVTRRIEDHVYGMATRNGSLYGVRVGDNHYTVNLMGDCFGVYNRDRFIENKFTFQWGRLGQDFPISDRLRTAIEEGRIYHKYDSNANLLEDHQVEGSVALSMEMVLCPGEPIKLIPLFYPQHFMHCIAVFRMARNSKIEKDMWQFDLDVPWYHLNFRDPLWLTIIGCYSYLTSFLLDREEVKDVALPWSVLMKAVERGFIPIDVKDIVEKCQWLEKYPRREVIGDGDFGIKHLKMRDEIFSTEPPLL